MRISKSIVLPNEGTHMLNEDIRALPNEDTRILPNEGTRTLWKEGGLKLPNLDEFSFILLAKSKLLALQIMTNAKNG